VLIKNNKKIKRTEISFKIVQKLRKKRGKKGGLENVEFFHIWP